MDKTVFPLATPTIDNGAITAEMLVNEPKRISRFIAEYAEESMLTPYLYTAENTTGGALLFEQLTENSAFAKNKPGVIQPGAEFPVISADTGEPVVVAVQKTGGKFPITDEAIKRNDVSLIERKALQVANTMRRDVDERGVRALNAALEKVPGALKVESKGWAAASKVAANAKTAATGEGQVLVDLLEAIEKMALTDLGYTPDTLLLHPSDAKNLKILYGVGGYGEFLANVGLTLRTSLALAPGEGIVLQARTVGVMGVEDPISTETYRLPETQTTYTQTWASLAFGVTDPLAMVKLTGIGA